MGDMRWATGRRNGPWRVGRWEKAARSEVSRRRRLEEGRVDESAREERRRRGRRTEDGRLQSSIRPEAAPTYPDTVRYLSRHTRPYYAFTTMYVTV